MKAIFILPIFWIGLSITLPAQTRNLQDLSSFQYGTLDYWMAKSRIPGTDFRELIQEFDSFWKGRTPVKGSGYKQFRRWQGQRCAYLNPDGSMRMPEDDLAVAMAYNSGTASFPIVGNWTYVGPNAPVYKADDPTVVAIQMGRISAIGFHPTNAQTIYAGAPLGGLWVSYNNGSSWQNMNTDGISALGVSAVAVHPDNPDIIFIGTGDKDSEETLGKGIYKTINGGISWEAKPLSTNHDKWISKIFFHPSDHNRMVISGNYGVYTSSDGGENWIKRLETFIWDMEQKPGDTVMYACSGNVIYRSPDFGKTWSGVDTLETNRLAITITPAHPDFVYLMASQGSGFKGIYRSVNSGMHYYKLQSTGIPQESQGSYNLDIVADPVNGNILYAGMVNFYKSVDGGYTWANQEVVTADDQHVFEFNPHNHRLYIGNDSGIWYTDNGTNYTYASTGLNIAEIRHFDVDVQNPDHIIMGIQDASTFVTNGGPYYSSIGGDGMTCKIDYDNPEYVYGSSQEGNIQRSTNGGDVNAGFHDVIHGTCGINQPGNWQTAFLLDYQNPNCMIAGMKDIWRTIEIRKNSPNEIGWLNISNGVFGECTIEFIEQSRADHNILYVFTDRQTIYRCTNFFSTSPTWTKLTNPGNSFDVRFETHPSNPNIVYMVSGTKVYKSMDKGTNWQNISGTLTGLGMRSLAYMNGSPDGLFLGTNAGVYYKDTTMADWVPFKSGLPLTRVNDLAINYSTNPPQVFAASYGRGVWKTSALTTYEPDLIAGNGNSTMSGTSVSAVNGYSLSNSMVSIPEYSIGYYLSTNTIISSGDHLVLELDCIDGNPGLILQSQLPATDVALINPPIEPGSYYLGLYLDNTFSIDESIETNNYWVSTSQVTIPSNPVPPGSVTASDGTYTDKVQIQWTNSSGESLYFAVFRATLNLSSLAVQISPDSWLSGSSFDDTTAIPGKTYYYFVKSSRYGNGWRAGDFSASDAGSREISPPEDVEASDGQYSDRIVIKWSSCYGATHYKVYRNTTPVATELNVLSGLIWIPDTSFTDLTAVTGVTYYYWVRAAKSELGSYASGFSAANTGWVAFTSAPDAVASDGTYTDRVEVSWNTVAGANYYRLYRGTSRIWIGAIAISDWQTGSTFNDTGTETGTIYYYWVKASANASGTNPTGFGNSDTGFKNFIPPTGVIATDGSSTSSIQITWNSVENANWYRVYRSSYNIPCECPISNWMTARKFLDSSPVPGALYYYWVKAAGDTNITISTHSSSNSGYRKIAAPSVTATTGTFTDRVVINWTSVQGAGYYRVSRAPVTEPASQVVLANWSSSLGYTYTDLTAASGQQYKYYITGAVNGSGTRAGNTGDDTGYSGSCGNLVDVPLERQIDFHGTTLEFTQRLTNEGPQALEAESIVTIMLENDSPDGVPEVVIGTVTIPPLAAGSFYEYDYVVNLDTLSGFNLTFGQWHLTFGLSQSGSNCDSDPGNDYFIWDNPYFTYTNALHGTYLVGPVAGNFSNLTKVMEALDERGISDPVIFLLEPGLFNEQLSFSQVNGAGTNKRITFKSQFISDMATIIAYPSDAENYTLQFNNAAFITFQDLILQTNGYSNFQSTYGRVISIEGSSHDLKFKGNKITGNPDPSHQGINNNVIHSDNTSCYNLIFDGNEIQNGYNAIFLSGVNLTGVSMTGVQILRNEIINFQHTGIWLEYQDNPLVLSNLLHQDTQMSDYITGIYLNQCRNGFTITHNRVQLAALDKNLYGIILTECNMDGSQMGLVANNFISLGGGNAGLYGLHIYNTHKSRYLYNSIQLYGSNAPLSTCIWADCQAEPFLFDNSLVNNNVYNRTGGYAMYLNANAYLQNFFAESDYNNLIAEGTYMAFVRDTNLPDIASWISFSGFDAHSLSVDPMFVNETDLHSTSPQIDDAGSPRTEVTTDIDQENRSTSRPDIGADEFTPPPPSKTLTVSVFLEGLYSGLNQMNPARDENGPHFGTGIADKITIELHSASNYNTLVYSTGNLNLGTSGLAVAAIPGNYSSSYYLTIRHRNSITVTSALPVSFAASSINYAFNQPSKVFGGNVYLKPQGNYVVYGGDVNQDDLVDSSDMIMVDNDSSDFSAGYLASDVNGDGLVDSSDMIIVDNNSGNFIGAILP